MAHIKPIHPCKHTYSLLSCRIHSIAVSELDGPGSTPKTHRKGPELAAASPPVPDADGAPKATVKAQGEQLRYPHIILDDREDVKDMGHC